MRQFHSLIFQTYLNLERDTALFILRVSIKFRLFIYNFHYNILACASTIQEPPTNQTSKHSLIRHTTEMHVLC
jgi:hypothetical protein